MDALVDTLDARIREIAREVINERCDADCRYVSKIKLAELLGVSPRRVKTLRAHGLPARKIGRDLYFDLDEVETFLDHEGAVARE
jgi:hypothetical protein